jgi:hypothetical protein
MGISRKPIRYERAGAKTQRAVELVRPDQLLLNQLLLKRRRRRNRLRRSPLTWRARMCCSDGGAGDPVDQ